jgi:hypothetical protein
VTTQTRKRRDWRPGETIDVTSEVEVREWAKRLSITAEELRTIVAEIGDRSATVATACGVPLRGLDS